MKRSTLAVAAVLLLLVGYIYFYEREPVVEERRAPLFEVEAASIEHIEIQARDAEPVVVDKTAGSWVVSAPLSVDADQDEIARLAQNLTTAEPERVLGDVTELSAEGFGLDEPALEVRFRLADGGERGLQFGRDTPTGTTRYARRSGENEILVVSSHLIHNFEKTLWDLRDKRIFQYPEDVTARRVEVERPDGKLLLENQSGLWFVSAGPRARADRFAVEGLVSSFRRAEMMDIVSETSEGLNSLGLEPSRYALRIEWTDDTLLPLEIRVGRKATIDFYARAPARPQVFLLDAALVTELGKPAGDYRSARLFDFTTSGVRRVRLRSASEPDLHFDVEASEDEAAWAPVEELLFEMSGVRAEEIIERPSIRELALDDPEIIVTVWSGSPERKETIRVGKPEGESVFVQREGDDVVLRVAADRWTEVESLFNLEEAKAPE